MGQENTRAIPPTRQLGTPPRLRQYRRRPMEPQAKGIGSKLPHTTNFRRKHRQPPYEHEIPDAEDTFIARDIATRRSLQQIEIGARVPRRDAPHMRASCLDRERPVWQPRQYLVDERRRMKTKGSAPSPSCPERGISIVHAAYPAWKCYMLDCGLALCLAGHRGTDHVRPLPQRHTETHGGRRGGPAVMSHEMMRIVRPVFGASLQVR